MSSSVPRTFNLGTIHWGQSNIWHENSVLWRTIPAAGWMPLISSPRRCPEKSTVSIKKRISPTFKYYLFRKYFYRLVFIAYISAMQSRWNSNQQSKHVSDLSYQPMNLPWILNFQKFGMHWTALNTKRCHRDRTSTVGVRSAQVITVIISHDSAELGGNAKVTWIEFQRTEFTLLPRIDTLDYKQTNKTNNIWC